MTLTPERAYAATSWRERNIRRVQQSSRHATECCEGSRSNIYEQNRLRGLCAAHGEVAEKRCARSLSSAVVPCERTRTAKTHTHTHSFSRKRRRGSSGSGRRPPALPKQTSGTSERRCTPPSAAPSQQIVNARNCLRTYFGAFVGVHNAASLSTCHACDFESLGP